MSTFELKFFTLEWNEAEIFKVLKHEAGCLLDLCLKVWKTLISRAQLSLCIFRILELTFKIICFFRRILLSVQKSFEN